MSGECDNCGEHTLECKCNHAMPSTGWISIKNELPPQGTPIRIKANYGKNIVDAICTFRIVDIDEYNEAWVWSMTPEIGEKYGTLRPTHWMPLPKPPRDND